jgi:hypothetical protein
MRQSTARLERRATNGEAYLSFLAEQRFLTGKSDVRIAAKPCAGSRRRHSIMHPRFRRLSWVFLALALGQLLAPEAFSQVLSDVYPKAQTNYLPGTFVVLANPLTGDNYHALYGDGQDGYVYASVVDTGSSGSVICATEAQARSLPNTGESYYDVGIGGTESFRVSGSTTLKLAAVDSGAVTGSLLQGFQEHVEKFNAAFGDYKFQVRKTDPQLDVGFGVMATIMINTIGTPVLNRYAMHVRNTDPVFPYVMDDVGVTPVNYVPTDLIDKSSLPANLKASSSELVLVPKVGGTNSTLHVPLVYKDFIDYGLNPQPAPTVSTNPTIPQVKLTLGAGSVTSDWLFDSGAAVTMMGRDLATSLGVNFSQPVSSTMVLGVGGTTTIDGYQVDQLILSLADHSTLTFHDVVVFVPNEGDMPANLPGIFGMNLLNDAFSSMDDTGREINPKSSDFSDWYVVPPAAVPEPATLVLLTIGASIFFVRRRLRRRLI